MGTRNLTSVVVDGETKIAQYCQWDGMPVGQGRDIATFLHWEGSNLDAFREKVRGLRWLSKEEVAERWKEFSAKDGWATMDESNAFAKKYPGLHRDTGAGILNLVNEGEVSEVVDESDFVNDTLFCEWAYTVDLDNETVTVVYGYPERQSRVFTFDEFTTDAIDAWDEEDR